MWNCPVSGDPYPGKGNEEITRILWILRLTATNFFQRLSIGLNRFSIDDLVSERK